MGLLATQEVNVFNLRLNDINVTDHWGGDLTDRCGIVLRSPCRRRGDATGSAERL
jgi:hypothetical protein